MTNKHPNKYEINPGEFVDIAGAFDRHPALNGIQLETDTESTRVSRAMTGETKTIHTTVGYGLWMSPTTFSALIKILNAAPVNGDPLQATVNLMDVVIFQHERDHLARFLEENNHEPTLENIADWYLESGTKYALPVDVVLGGERKRYAVTRVTSKHDRVTPGDTKELSRLRVLVPGQSVTIAINKDEINIEDLEGLHLSNGKYRILHALEPGGKAPLGGFILERIK